MSYITCYCVCSPLLHLNQSGGGGASLLSSAHVVQMQESLRETRRGLERSQDAQAASERTRRQLEAQLEETRKKYDDVFRAKLKLENAKLDMELQVCESVRWKREGEGGRWTERKGQGVCTNMYPPPPTLSVTRDALQAGARTRESPQQ